MPVQPIVLSRQAIQFKVNQARFMQKNVAWQNHSVMEKRSMEIIIFTKKVKTIFLISAQTKGLKGYRLNS